MRTLQLQYFAKLQNWLPKVRVVGNDQPGRRRAQLMNPLESFIDVFEHSDRVRDDDVVERPFDRSYRFAIFHVSDNEVEIGMGCPRTCDLSIAEIDPDSVGG